MNKIQYTLALSVILLIALPVLSQAQVNDVPDSDGTGNITETVPHEAAETPDGVYDDADAFPYEASETVDVHDDVTSDLAEYRDVDNSSDALTGGRSHGSGSDDTTGIVDFTVCDSRGDETGRRITISAAGSIITRSYSDCNLAASASIRGLGLATNPLYE